MWHIHPLPPLITNGSSTSMMDTPLNVLIPVEYISPSIPTLCNPKYTMFHFGVVSHSFTKEPQHDFTCLASPKGEMESPFSWNSFLKSPRSSTLCLVNLLLQSSIKNQHLQSSIKSSCVKLSLTSQSLHLFGIPQQRIGTAH